MSLSYLDCVLLLSLSVFLYGIYGGIRKHYASNVDSIPFTILYILGQLFFAIILWVCQPERFEGDIRIEKVVFIMVGGSAVLFAEYLYLAVCQHVNSSTAIACLSIEYAFGIYIDYLISSANINLKFLVVGSFLGLCGLFSVVAAEYFKPEEAQLQSNRAYEDELDGSASIQEKTAISADFEIELGETCADGFVEELALPPTSPSELISTNAVDETYHSFWFWIAIGLVAGIICSSWSILPALGQTGVGSVKNPAIILLSFQAGQFVTLPVITYVFGYCNILGNIKNPINSFAALFDSIVCCPLIELAWSFLIGIIVSIGYAGYFYGASGPVPIAVSYALMMSVVLMATLSGVFLFGEYRHVPILSWTYTFIWVGVLLYAAAIYVFLILAF